MKNNDSYMLNLIYRGTQTISEFQWDNLNTRPLLTLISREEIEAIHKIITSARFSGNNRIKMQKIDEIMNPRGFRRFAGGTNRLVYEHPAAPNAVFKVAIDSVGITDNPSEYYNQKFLKPYCTKVFECSPCGTIASFERVERIKNFDEFASIADCYYNLMTSFIIGKYIMEDVGIDYFMNFGIRLGDTDASGPVILDFPYLYELDGNKLICNMELEDGSHCGGEIDYDKSFNYLVCSKCGTIYRARDLAKNPEDSKILIRDKGARRMKITLTKGGKVVKRIDTCKISDHFTKDDDYRVKKQYPDHVIVHLIKPTVVETPVDTPKKEEVKAEEINTTKKPVTEDKKEVIRNKTVTIHLGKAHGDYHIQKNDSVKVTTTTTNHNPVVDTKSSNESDTAKEIVSGNELLDKISGKPDLSKTVVKANDTEKHIIKVTLSTGKEDKQNEQHVSEEKENAETVQEENPEEQKLLGEGESAAGLDGHKDVSEVEPVDIETEVQHPVENNASGSITSSSYKEDDKESETVIVNGITEEDAAKLANAMLANHFDKEEETPPVAGVVFEDTIVEDTNPDNEAIAKLMSNNKKQSVSEIIG